MLVLVLVLVLCAEASCVADQGAALKSRCSRGFRDFRSPLGVGSRANEFGRVQVRGGATLVGRFDQSGISRLKSENKTCLLRSPARIEPVSPSAKSPIAILATR